MNGPRCTVASAGPWVLRQSEEMSGIRVSSSSGPYSTWPLRLGPADMFKLSAVQSEVSSCLALPCAVTLHSKVAFLSRWRHAPLQRVGRRTFVRVSACRPVPWPSGNSCEAGSACFATSSGAALPNAAPDRLKCQVELCERFPRLCTVADIGSASICGAGYRALQRCSRDS